MGPRAEAGRRCMVGACSYWDAPSFVPPPICNNFPEGGKERTHTL